MKTVILVLAYATLTSSARDKRSWSHSYPVPVSVHTVVRPSSTLPVYEYPESTEIQTHAKTVYSVSVPITHTVHLEQPEHSSQIIYHNAPQIPYSYNTPSYSYNSVQAPVYTPQYTPEVYTSQYSSPVYTPIRRRVYKVESPWPYQRYASTWC